MSLDITLLFFIFASYGVAQELPGYRVWERAYTAGQVDIFTPSTLTVSHLNGEGEVTGYYHHLDSGITGRSYHLFARNACAPYTVMQWRGGEVGVISGGHCHYNARHWAYNATLLLLGRPRLYLPFGNFSQIKYDWSSRQLYAYRAPGLYVFRTEDFQLVRSYHLPTLQHFYPSGGMLFYTRNNTLHAFGKGKHTRLGAAPHGQFTSLYVYDGREDGKEKDADMRLVTILLYVLGTATGTLCCTTTGLFYYRFCRRQFTRRRQNTPSL